MLFVFIFIILYNVYTHIFSGSSCQKYAMNNLKWIFGLLGIQKFTIL